MFAQQEGEGDHRKKLLPVLLVFPQSYFTHIAALDLVGNVLCSLLLSTSNCRGLIAMVFAEKVKHSLLESTYSTLCVLTK
jgi:hypothetical protein